MTTWTEYSLVFFEQLILFMRKILRQKWTNGRETIKEFLIPMVLIAMTIYIFAQSVDSDGFFAASYDLVRLPPLAEADSAWGIFQAPPSDDDAGSSFTVNYVSKQRLYYSPNNHDGVNELMTALKDKYPDIDLFGEKSSNDVSTQYEENMFTVWAALNFDLTEDQMASGSFLSNDDDGGVSNVKYTIRMNPQIITLPDYQTDGSVYRDAVAAADWYSKSGYLTLQNFVTTYVAALYPEVDDNFSVDMFIQRYPYTTTQEEAPGIDYETLRFFLWKWMGSTILTLAIFLPVLMILIQPVKERASRMKDLLQISGMLDTSYYMSYILGAYIVIMAISTVCILFLAAGLVLSEYHFSPYFSLLACYGFGLISFSLAFGFVIPRPEFIGLPLYILQAGLAVGGCYLANDYSIPSGLKLFIGTLFPPINFTNGIFAIEVYLYHHSGESMDFNHIDTDKNLPSLNGVCACLIVSAALYFFVAVGMPFDWLFTDEGTAASIAANMRDDDDIEDIEDKDGAIEAGLENDVLSVRDLTQVYPDGTKAVKGITFSVASGEILSFLGANGAGKSTTMNMLSGTLAPSFGDAKINGHSITREKTMACRNLGICMQQDVIWEDISIRDHLLLFGRLRGLHGKKLQDNVDNMLQTLGFPEKAHSLAGTLSGGQKRRLCVGISMVGDNPVVFLDEPTAGLDPVSRRQLWELVQANRHNRAILLTTHFMDEADVLGDRIAIVKDGHVRAIGTSRYLKKKFGVGYLLRSSLEPEADKKPIVDIIQRHVPAAELVSDAGTELSMRLPLEASELFPRLFQELEGPGRDRGILSFGIETTTLEEVFMNIVNEDTSASSSVQEADKLIGASSAERTENLQSLLKRDSKKHPVTDADIQLMLTPGSTDFDFNAADAWTQTKNMLDKRRAQFFRSKGQRIFGFIFPLVVLCLTGAVFDKVPTSVTDSDPDPYKIEYNEWYTTPIAAETEDLAATYAAAASIVDFTYTGSTYDSVYDYVYNETQQDATSKLTNSSSDSLYFQSYNNFTVLYNATLPLNFPSIVNDVLQSITANVTDSKLTVETECQPFPLSTIGDQLNYGIIAMLMLALCAGSIGGGISIVLSGERVQLVKHQQLASGASRLAYWTANFIMDSAVILVQLIFLVIILAVVSKSDYTNEGAGVVIAGGLLWLLNLVFRFYIFAFFISEVRAAQTFYFYGSLMSMYILCVVYVIIVQDASGGDVNTTLSRTMAAIVSALDPTVAFGLVIFYQKNFLGVRSTNGNDPTLSNNVAGLIVLVMGLTCIAYFFTFVIMEMGWSGVRNFVRDLFARCSGSKDSSGSSLLGSGSSTMAVTEDSDLAGFVEIAASGALDLDKKIDEDVNKERHRIDGIFERKQLNVRQHAIFIHHLSKIYYGRGAMKTKIAVKEFNLAVAQGEVFGLLGANGAGKTTLLKMVSGLESPTGGMGVINGFDVVNQTSQAQRSMGLCPQFDTLIERYSVLENLFFFASVKGIAQDKISDVVEAFMKALNIKKYENKLIQHLSGGNRRKVSLAVALLGCPPTVYLDEPSTGLDPVASRLMWRLLSSVAAKKTSAIVLTTHNMLECEAVCTRVGVMKNGELVCLGSSQHLRNVHGTGFLFEAVLSSHEAEAVRKLKQFVEDNFANAAIVDEHGSMVNYEIPRGSIGKLSEAFDLLESNKHALQISDYSLSQSTLEQVFLKQIRPTNAESTLAEQQRIGGVRLPTCLDYFLGYLIWLLALFLPGLHHFYLGNTARGFKYLFTVNEFLVGWFLDLFELHMLIRKSVDEFGNAQCCGCCRSGSASVSSCTRPESSSYNPPRDELNVN